MSGINIEITASTKRKDSSINASGTVLHIITDKEVNTFGLNDEKLKSAVDKYAGRKPNDAFLHSPTRWGDLYKKHGWEEVTTVLTVEDAKVIDVESKDHMIADKDLKNTSQKRATFKADIEHEEENSTETNWSKTNTIEVSQSFKYGVTFLGTGVEGTTSMSYSHAWGEGGVKKKAVKFKATAGVSVDLEPNESAKVELTASRGVMKVKIFYRAKLEGSVAVNYSKSHKGHHFWGYNISKVMQAAGISNSLEFTEDIEIVFYSNGKVELKNGDQPSTGGHKDADPSKDVNSNGDSYTAVQNNTKAQMYIKYTPNSRGLEISSILLDVLGVIPAKDMDKGDASEVGADGEKMTVTTFSARINDQLKKKEFSKVPPGEKHTSGKLSPKLAHQAVIMLVEQLDDTRVSIKRGSIMMFNEATNGSTKDYNASEATYEEEQELTFDSNDEENHGGEEQENSNGEENDKAQEDNNDEKGNNDEETGNGQENDNGEESGNDQKNNNEEENDNGEETGNDQENNNEEGGGNDQGNNNGEETGNDQENNNEEGGGNDQENDNGEQSANDQGNNNEEENNNGEEQS